MKRATLYNLNSVTLTLIVFGILAMINFLGYRHYKRVDFTKQKSFSLAPQSIKVVKALTEEVKITGFFKAQEKPLFDDLVSKYKYYSNKIIPRFVDPDKDIVLAKGYNVKRYQTIIVEKGKREARIDGFSDEGAEEKLTNAIIKVGKEKMPMIYFTKGHEEKGIKDREREGYSVAYDELKEAGYEVKELSLLEKGEIPGGTASEGCDVLVIAGPQKPFLPTEIELIDAYVRKGGRLMVLLDPQDHSIGIEAILEKIGIGVQRDIVVDPISTLFGQGAATPVVSQYGEHTIVRDLKLASFYPLARSLTIAKAPPQKNIHVEFLAQTSGNSWGEMGGIKSKKVRYDEGRDRKGPLHLAVAASGHWDEGNLALQKKEEMRLVAFGDSDFANNRSFGFSGNGNFFLNAMAWLVEDETAISIRPNTASVGRFIMTPGQIRFVFLLTVVILPLLIVSSGISVWWMRRKLA